jgi:hypothetical protein
MTQEYNQYFRDKVKGKIQAQFVLDSADHPEFTQTGSRKHYRVRLQLLTENAEARMVVYKLHPSYYDPLRESTDRKNNFAVEITTYGDYDFSVEVIVGTEVARQVLKLSTLLDEFHQPVKNQAIQQALEDIRSN